MMSAIRKGVTMAKMTKAATTQQIIARLKTDPLFVERKTWRLGKQPARIIGGKHPAQDGPAEDRGGRVADHEDEDRDAG